MIKANNSEMVDWYKAARRNRGSINKIAELTGRHRNWVRDVLKGVYRDDDVMLKAAKLLVDMESRNSEYRKAMQQMAEKMAEFAGAGSPFKQAATATA